MTDNTPELEVVDENDKAARSASLAEVQQLIGFCQGIENEVNAVKDANSANAKMIVGLLIAGILLCVIVVKLEKELKGFRALATGIVDGAAETVEVVTDAIT